MTRPSARRTAIQLVIGALIGSVVLVGYMAHQVSAQGARDERRPVDAIVVLGAAQFNGRPSDVFKARLEHSVALYKEGLAQYLIVTGGKVPEDSTTEAAVARAWAISQGVPEAAILAEDEGRTTLESLEAVARIFRANRFTTGLFVSDETHMLRVLRMASDLGIDAWGSPTRTSPADRDESRRRRAMIHEVAGLAAYYVGGAGLVGDSTMAGSP